MRYEIVQSECESFLDHQPEGHFDLIYIDPPFNTGGPQQRTRMKSVQDDGGERRGFGDKRYRTDIIDSPSYNDSFENFLDFLGPKLRRAAMLLKTHGSIFVHLDYREVHYVKVLLMDPIFGRKNFLNEIIWSYDYGGRSKVRWPAKHDTILWYVKDVGNYIFNYSEIDRIPYLAPSLVGPEKAKRGKVPTDVWWQTIVPTNSKEKTGYPTQKPIKLLERIIKTHSNPGDLVLDFFAGSGTTGEAAAKHGRGFVLVDENPAAIDVMERRLAAYKPKTIRPKSG